MKILHVEPARYPDELRRLMAEIGDVTYVDVQSQDDFDRVFASAKWDCVFLRLGVALTSQHLRASSHLRWIVTPTTGHAHIDLSLIHI